MNQLQQTINSREVAKMVERNHADVMRDMKKIISHLNESKIALVEYFIESTYKDAKGEERPCFELTKKGCELYSTRMTGSKGTSFAVAYIERFNQMENHIKQQLPTNYKEALLQLVEQVEINEKLEERALVAEQTNLELRPKALFADAVEASKSSILIGELAKVLKQNDIDIGQKRLFKWLRNNGYLIKRGEEINNPTQYSLDRGWFEIKKRTGLNADGSTWTSSTTKVTGKGQIYFVNRFLNEADLIK